MSTTTMAAPVRRGPVDLTARWFLIAQLRLARWVWGIGIVVVAISVAIYGATAETVDSSVAQYALQALCWLPLSVFIGLGLAYLPAHVASGLTRRALSRGALVAAFGTALGYGAAFALVLLAERAVYDAFGWTWSVGFDDGTVASAFLVASTTAFALSYTAGLLVGIVYLRHGGWWGTLTLPVTVGPVVLLMVLIPIVDPAQLYLAAGAALVLAAVEALVYDRLVRSAAVPPKR